MTNIKINKEDLKKIIKSEPELIERINLMGTPVEKVEQNEIEIQILPNRPDCLSVQGFLRAFKSFAGKGEKKNYRILQSDAKIIVDKSVEKIRPYSMAAIVKGIKFTDKRIKDIMQWQERIHATIGRNRKKVALGYYDLNRIKFPIKYTAKDPKEIIFEPLDMPQKLNGLEILQKHPTGREYANQLEGFEKFPVYYDSSNEILSMPPIINSNNSGKIIPGINDIFIECSGTDLQILKKVIIMALVDLIDLGGKAYSVKVVYGDKTESIDFSQEKKSISPDNVNKLIGINLKEREFENLLPKMGYSYKSGKVSIPPWRTDIIHEVDIIEDIAIAYGYDKLSPEIPEVATIGEESKESKAKEKISEILIGLDLIEISSYHLIKEDEIKKSSLEEGSLLSLKDSKTEYKLLRPNLSISALRTFSENKDNEYPQRIFEIGTVFLKDKKNSSETGIKESENLLIALSPGSFTELKQILDCITRILNIKYTLNESLNRILIDGRTAEIIVNNQKIGMMGEVHPETLNSFNIKMPVSLIELDLKEIFNSMN